MVDSTLLKLIIDLAKKVYGNDQQAYENFLRFNEIDVWPDGSCSIGNDNPED